ncbi:MAG: MerR family transcriptional regulator [Oscillospiraceae bacterium]
MEYHICELSEILQLSCDMIRYYEKKGVVCPKRDEKNNYRVYSTMDLLNLAEAIHFKQFDVNIGDIKQLKNNDYSENILKHLIALKCQLTDEVTYKNLLIERTDELIERYRISLANLGNFWVKHIPTYSKYRLCLIENNYFHEITPSTSVLHSLFSSTISPFCDGMVEFSDTVSNWNITISNKYSDFLELPEESKTIMPSQFCLCNVVNVDELEGFSPHCYQPLLAFAAKEGYRQAGAITGVLCSKGVEKNVFKRYLEVRMPVEL